MGQMHKVRLSCRVLFLMFASTVVLSEQIAHSQDDDSPPKSTNHENKKIIAIARHVIERHDANLSGYHEGTKPGHISKLQTLSASLDSLEIHEQAWVLLAINYLVQDSAAEVCHQVIQEHESGQVSDLDWIKTLSYTANLLPSYMNEPFLKSLEAWEQKYPYHISKIRPATMFQPYVVAQKKVDFLQLANGSKSAQIAGGAYLRLVEKDEEYLSLLEASANLNLATKNAQRRLHGFQIFSRLHPDWKGHLSRLKRLTNDPADNVARAATRVWLHNPLSNDGRRLLEALSADSDSEKLEALNQVDTNVIADWGSMEPVTKLVSSGSVEVRMAAIRTLSRTQTNLVQPLTQAIENDPVDKVRQFALEHVQLRGWNLPGNNDYDWARSGSADPYFALLADATRDGLKTEQAMQRLTAPFGFRPQELYENLQPGQLEEGEKLMAIAQLLDADPSLRATETAVVSLREIISDNQARNNQGYLGQASFAGELITRHARRLAPIVPELCSFIEQTRSTRLVKTLSSFGENGHPSLSLLIKILDDETGKWRKCRRSAIMAIRAMQHHGKPALESLLKLSHANDYSASLAAALTYLDLGGEPAALMPEYALSLPVLVKIEPALLITIPEFRSALQAAVIADCPWDLLRWLGPPAEFLLPELKLKFKQLTPAPGFKTSEIEKLAEVIPLLSAGQREFVPMCIEYLENEPRSLRCLTALETLTKIGDDQRLAEGVVKSLMDSPTAYIRRASTTCFEKLYQEQKD